MNTEAKVQKINANNIRKMNEVLHKTFLQALQTRRVLILVLILGVFIAVSCVSEGNQSTSEAQKGLLLYDNETLQLANVSYLEFIDDSMETQEQIQTIDNLLKEGIDGSKYEPVKLKNFEITNINIIDAHVSIAYDGAYYNQEPMEELLFRTALLNSVLSLEQVMSVEILINNRPLIIDDQVIGVQYASDLFLSYEEVTDQNETRKLDIYVPTKEKTDLEKHTVEVTITPNNKIEEILIHALLNNTDNPVLSDSIKLLNIYTHEGICFVDFSSEFKTADLPEGISERIAIYSIVNSLCNFEHIDSVQILVNGTVVPVFKENLTLNRIFTVNHSLIAQSQ